MTNHTIELTDKEVYALRTAIDQLTSIRDSEYRGVVALAEGIYNKLPSVPVTWNDVATQ